MWQQLLAEKTSLLNSAFRYLALSAVAVGQPLLDVVSHSPEFFLVKKSQPIDVIIFSLLPLLILPMLFMLVEYLLSTMKPVIARAFHYFTCFCLLLLVFAPHLKKLDLNLYIFVAILVALSSILLYALLKFQQALVFTRFLLLAPLVILVLFLADPSIATLIFSGKNTQTVSKEQQLKKPPHIVMVVFDELPLVSLLDKNLQVDPVRFPNFAALAAGSHWFRNATTVSDYTVTALPAMVTGNYPSIEDYRYKLPSLKQFPQNIFSWLNNSYSLRVHEPITQLSPVQVDPVQLGLRGFARRMGGLVKDAFLIYAHIILPAPLDKKLPQIQDNWAFFAEKLEKKKQVLYGRDFRDRVNLELQKVDQVDQFVDFIDSLYFPDRPTFFFLHTLFPHMPWRFLPNGDKYSLRPAEVFGLHDRTKWRGSEFAVTQGWQRHLLQVGYLDRLLGRLLKRLKELNLYDESLLVITSDHGTNFRRFSHRRRLVPASAGQLISIPLFIKEPGQKIGQVHDKNVENIDLVDSIAGLLKTKVPWRTDGKSVFAGKNRGGKTSFSFYTYEKLQQYNFSARLPQKYRALKGKLKYFSSNTTLNNLYRIGPNQVLLKQSIEDLPKKRLQKLKIVLNDISLYQHVNKESGFVPAYLAGKIQGPGKKVPLDLAVAVNGHVVALAQSLHHEGAAAFSAMIPPSSFVNGKNKVQVFIVKKNKQKGNELVLYCEACPG